MYMKVSDEKFLDKYHYFMRFMDFYCRQDADMMDHVKNTMKERKSQILSYERRRFLEGIKLLYKIWPSN